MSDTESFILKTYLLKGSCCNILAAHQDIWDTIRAFKMRNIPKNGVTCSHDQMSLKRIQKEYVQTLTIS